MSIITNQNKENILIFSLLIAFLAINIYTSSRSPTVWNDEISYADPAVNFVTNGDFTSTAWGYQGSDELWAGNVPLHQLILVGWLKIFGISPTSVRSINYIFAALGVFLLWVLMRNKDLSSPSLRITTAVLLLCGQGITFSYRSGRPDMIGFLLICAAAYVMLYRGKTRHGLLAMVGALIPWAGLQFIPYVVLLCGCIFFWNRKLFLEAALSITGGGMTGTVGLVVFYKSNGVWDNFIQSVFPHTAANQSNAFPGLHLYAEDLSYLTILLSAILIFLVYAINYKKASKLHPIFKYCMLVGILTPPVLYTLGKYPQYYTWMAYLPLVVGVCVQASFIRWNRWALWIGIGIIGVASIWLPARMGVTLLQWDARSYEPVENLALRTISEKDTVYASYPAYYGVKKNSAFTYLPNSLSDRRPPESGKVDTQSINKVMIDPRHSENFFSELGGEWRQISQIGEDAERKEVFGIKLAEPYRLATYVRLSSKKLH